MIPPVSGQRCKGSILELRCQHCGKANQYKRPVVKVELLNNARERAEKAEDLIREAAGCEVVLLPVATLNAISARAEAAEGQLEKLIDSLDYRSSGTDAQGDGAHRHA